MKSRAQCKVFPNENSLTSLRGMMSWIREPPQSPLVAMLLIRFFRLSVFFLLSHTTSTQASQAPLVSTMSDLRSWTETHFTELYSAHETDAFASAYSSTFAPDVSIAFADAPQRDSQGVMHVTAGQGSREERAQGEEARKALEARAKGGPQASTSRVEFTELDVDEVCFLSNHGIGR